ncbi:hypothetical protein A3E42_03260 [Candidatus Gottesmanbacteria bacterium RIFCSPHIGHO2_12_FULL_40_13]|nr:MAG: hypothetical protein A3E42_03260 [Candidatus Gottesmanbacteria bacterium RIFCSPHIGHO2_12_FULL_40_13]
MRKIETIRQHLLYSALEEKNFRLYHSGSVNIDKIKKLKNRYLLKDYWLNFTNILSETTKVAELNINPHQLSKIKKKLV